LPYVFTQEGIAMLSSVLRSSRAAAVNVEIMRAFIHNTRDADDQASAVFVKRDRALFIAK
jgi:hypothetical protein